MNWHDLKITLALKWRFFKERVFGRFACWYHNEHLVTMLEDDETIYCERCGKVFGTAEFKVPSPTKTYGYLLAENEEAVHSRPIEDLKEKLTKLDIHEEAKRILAEVDKEIPIKTPEEIVRERWLSEPKTRRRRIRDRSKVPAFRHGDAIAKHMKGKGGRQHSTYRRMTKKRTSKEELEEN